MNFCDFYAGADDENRRLDRVIRIFAKNLSLPQIYSAIRKNLIRVNDKKTDSAYHLQKNDKISIAEFLINQENQKSENAQNEKNQKSENSKPEKKSDFSEEKFSKLIVFENEHILILNKPYNISVHDGKNNLNLMVCEYLQKDSRDSLSFTPGPLHRLDKQTTGLIAFSKSIEGARWFSKEIQCHSIKKKYLGIAQGKLEKTETWEDEIPQDAKTIATPLSHSFYKKNEISLVEFSILTGRKHQIRIQSQIHKIPLLGDERYGAQKQNSLPRNFFLHAKLLQFPENPLNLPPEIECPLAPDFKSFLEQCNFPLKTLNLEL